MSGDLFDYEMMLKAIKVGERGRITAPPNPWVGCVIVKNGIVIAEGAHMRAGTPHAEPVALAQTTEARNSTLYVTLEPCAHHGRTPPCTQAIIKAGIARVVVGVTDPDPRVSGKGIEELRKAGIHVDCGIAEKEVRKSLAPYLHQRSHNSVYTVLKIACTLDGCMSAADGSSQWITGEDARNDAMRLRAESQAIVTGVGTVLVDNPKMNVRAPIVGSQNQLLRVVLDTQGKAPPDAHIFNPDFGPSLLLTSSQCPESVLKAFENRGVETKILPLDEGKISLVEALQFLSERGILQTLIEGGPTLTSAFLKKQLFQQLTAYIGPKIMGGKGQMFSKNLDWQAMGEALPLELTAQTNLNGTVKLVYHHQIHQIHRLR